MPEPTLTTGKKSALKKGPKVLKRVGRKAAGTLAIRREVAKALKQLAAIDAALWCHRTLKGCTPAMAAGIARAPWSVRDLLEA